MTDDCINPITQKQKDVWLEALRSGKFPQGDEQLSNGHEYCCLGVLAKTLGRLQKNIYGAMCYTLESNKNGSTAFLGTPKVDAGKDCSEMLPFSVQEDLASMNDGGYTFDEIADWIEKNVKAVDE